MAKKINEELKELLASQIEIEGFDYAMVEKISLDDWTEGAVPDDLKKSHETYLAARLALKAVIEGYGIDPM